VSKSEEAKDQWKFDSTDRIDEPSVPISEERKDEKNYKTDQKGVNKNAPISTVFQSLQKN
jgi:hypothetical protein